MLFAYDNILTQITWRATLKTKSQGLKADLRNLSDVLKAPEGGRIPRGNRGGSRNSVSSASSQLLFGLLQRGRGESRVFSLPPLGLFMCHLLASSQLLFSLLQKARERRKQSLSLTPFGHFSTSLPRGKESRKENPLSASSWPSPWHLLSLLSREAK